jgi:hypothetical protein
MDELINSDEMVELMAPDDRNAVKEEVRRHLRECTERAEYSSTWHAEKVRIARAAAQARALASAKGKAKARGKALPPMRIDWKGLNAFPVGVPLQSQVKHLVPPGASVWRRNRYQAWAGHLPPHPRISRAWHLYGGHDKALRLLCQTLWQQYLFANGLSQADCPISGLFESGG